VKQLSREVNLLLQKLRHHLGLIHRHAQEGLADLAALERELVPQHVRWTCYGCGYTKNFTKPSSVVACDSCPRCKGTEFSPSVNG